MSAAVFNGAEFNQQRTFLLWTYRTLLLGANTLTADALTANEIVAQYAQQFGGDVNLLQFLTTLCRVEVYMNRK